MRYAAPTVVLLALIGATGCERHGLEYAGCSFQYRNGRCDIWYSRKDYQVIDILIRPLPEEHNYYNAAKSILHLPEGDVRFGAQGMAFIFDGTNWTKRPLTRFHEKNIPYVSKLQSCTNILEIADRVLEHPEQP